MSRVVMVMSRVVMVMSRVVIVISRILMVMSRVVMVMSRVVMVISRVLMVMSRDQVPWSPAGIFQFNFQLCIQRFLSVVSSIKVHNTCKFSIATDMLL